MKKRMLKGLLATATPISFAAIALSASCGPNKNSFEEITDKQGNKTIKTLSNIQSKKGLTLNSQWTVKTAPRVKMITDEGSVTDKSFNQSAWEAVHKVSYDLGLDGANVTKDTKNTYVEPSSATDLVNTYKKAIDDGYKWLVLNGFTHGDYLTELAKDASYAKKIQDNGVIFICVDFNGTEKILAGNPNLVGHTLNILFNTKQAGFMAGRALADYFAKKYPGATAADQAKRTLGAFGGIPFPAVTDFIEGILKGIWSYDDEATTTAKTKTIANTIKLDTLFDTSDVSKTNAIVDSIKSANAYFPVAGSFTASVVASMKKWKYLDDGHVIIGVDTDQAKAFAKGTPFLTSVIKKVGQAVYSLLANLYSKGPDHLTIYTGFQLNVHDADPKLYSYNATDKGESYVDIAEASLPVAADQTIAQQAITDSISYFDNAANKTAIDTLLADDMGHGDMTKGKFWSGIVNYWANKLFNL